MVVFIPNDPFHITGTLILQIIDMLSLINHLAQDNDSGIDGKKDARSWMGIHSVEAKMGTDTGS